MVSPPRRLGGEIRIRASFDDPGRLPSRIGIVVQDTGAGATRAVFERGRLTGVGLRNVERRLTRQYGDAASLSIRTSPDAGTTVEITLPAERTATDDVGVRGAQQPIPEPVQSSQPGVPASLHAPRSRAHSTDQPLPSRVPAPLGPDAT